MSESRNSLFQLINRLSQIAGYTAALSILAATLIINGLANILPLNGLRSGDVTAQYPVLFVPAPYVFAIWGVIYAGLIAFAIFLVVKQINRMKREAPAAPAAPPEPSNEEKLLVEIRDLLKK